MTPKALDPLRRKQRALDLVNLVYIGPIINRHLDSINLGLSS